MTKHSRLSCFVVLVAISCASLEAYAQTASTPASGEDVPASQSEPVNVPRVAEPMVPKPSNEVAETVNPEPDRGAHPKLIGLEASLGLASPGGLASGGLVLRWSNIAAVAGGVGVNYDGAQFYAGVRVQPLELMPAVRPGLSLTWSMGKYAHGRFSKFQYWSPAHWLNAELYVSIRVAPRWELRPFVGAAVVLNRSKCATLSIEGSPCAHPFTWLPLLGIGGSFDLL
jgi:hypothetical protein